MSSVAAARLAGISTGPMESKAAWERASMPARCSSRRSLLRSLHVLGRLREGGVGQPGVQALHLRHDPLLHQHPLLPAALVVVALVHQRLDLVEAVGVLDRQPAQGVVPDQDRHVADVRGVDVDDVVAAPRLALAVAVVAVRHLGRIARIGHEQLHAHVRVPVEPAGGRIPVEVLVALAHDDLLAADLGQVLGVLAQVALLAEVHGEDLGGGRGGGQDLGQEQEREAEKASLHRVRVPRGPGGDGVGRSGY